MILLTPSSGLALQDITPDTPEAKSPLLHLDLGAVTSKENHRNLLVTKEDTLTQSYKHLLNGISDTGLHTQMKGGKSKTSIVCCTVTPFMRPLRMNSVFTSSTDKMCYEESLAIDWLWNHVKFRLQNAIAFSSAPANCS
ncbi:hypothetical protein AMELA_G00201060 [Ameiurus melas]|uniref:Uncharacterized protein n=1 Tax=Ameiurus melas TaxID=219545 RepID=A0A7J6A9B6_AMEME|nr:hypothetical protein AMELA_G00201060 [Ameiurus melas]